MAKVFAEMLPEHQAFIQRQSLFFVVTAPLAADGVPLYDYQGQRPTLPAWADKKGPDGLAQYQRAKGSQSIDGLVTPLGQAAAQGD